MITDREKQDLIQELLDKVLFHGCGSAMGIGYHTMKLKGRKREVMESLTEKDFQHRYP